jgi:hypothetical protein
MSDICDVTQQTAAGTRQAAVSVSNLAMLADRLRASVCTFKVPNDVKLGRPSTESGSRLKQEPIASHSGKSTPTYPTPVQPKKALPGARDVAQTARVKAEERQADVARLEEKLGIR